MQALCAKNHNFNLILYHASCADGFGAAYAAWCALGDTAEYIACRHGDPPPDVKGRRVLVVDFSFSRETTIRLNEDAEFFMILDHHKSAMDELCDLPYAYFNMEHSGAMLAWKFFHPTVEPPMLISYIEDRDLWKWELPFSREFSAALDLVPFSFEEYKKLEFEPALYDFIKRGMAINEYIERQVKNICKSPVTCEIKGYEDQKAVIVNSSRWHSEIGSYLVNHYCDVGIIWSHDHLQNKIKVSLRSRSHENDVSLIAKSFGGGGHAQASGFAIDLDTQRLEDFFNEIT